ncbi:hypothetical protein [Tardiphaga sp.]
MLPPYTKRHLQRIGDARMTPYWQPFHQIVLDPADATHTIRTD